MTTGTMGAAAHKMTVIPTMQQYDYKSNEMAPFVLFFFAVSAEAILNK